MGQDIGKVGMCPQGMYERTRAYERLDVVTYQGSSWVAVVDVPAQISPADGSDYWQLVARIGETGPQGPVGPQGNSAFMNDGTVNKYELVNNLTQGGENAVLSAEQGKILKQEITELESETSELSAEIEGVKSRTLNFITNASYAETLFESPIKKGEEIRVINFSTSTGAYFTREDGSLVDGLIDVNAFPKVLTETYRGIKTSESVNVSIVVNQDTKGIKDELKEVNEKLSALDKIYEIQEIVQGRGIEEFNLSAKGAYAEVLFPVLIPKGATIVSIVLPITNNAYLTREDGSFNVETPINSLTFPLDVTETYRGMKVQDSATFNIVVDFKKEGLVSKINKAEDVVTRVDKLESYVLGVTPIHKKEKGSLETQSYDKEALFTEIIPKGAVVTKIQCSEGIWWLTSTDGGAKTEISAIQFPYTTTQEYRGFRASTSGTYLIEYYFGNRIYSNVREVLRVNTSDTDIAIFQKFLYAFRKGYVDVVFEKGIYELKEVYIEMLEELTTGYAIGLPIGNDCRYFFNGSTIISNTPSNGFNQSRNILDSVLVGSNYEVHDVILINNGGRYCIHDEADKSLTPYTHKYYNVQMIYNSTDTTPDSGAKPFGCGLGYDSNLVFDSCEFVHNGEQGTTFAIHGVVNATKAQTFRLSMKNCYFNKNGIYVNEIDNNRDTIEYYLVGNLWGYDFTDGNYTKLIKWNNVVA